MISIHRKSSDGVRYGLIDAFRGIAVINMIAYHLCYDIFCVFGVWTNFWLHPAFMLWERFICSSFILISGISLHFTRRGYYRGITVSLCGIVITAATLIFMPEQSIWFGVLSFIGAAMIITYALRKPLNRINPWLGTVIFLALFILTYGVPNGYIGIINLPLIHLPEAMYRVIWLAPLGFPSAGFSSSDYFPILPWIFLYMAGYTLWRIIKAKELDKHLYKNIPVLSFIGRHSLIIYMIHQPVLYGICLLWFEVIAK